MQPTLSPTTDRQTVLSLIETATHHLTINGFDEARLHVEVLLADVLNYSRLQLYTNFDRPLTPDEVKNFRALFKRRLTHEPLQYIIGETEFMGIPFLVNKHVLIPRPETELLVERALEAIRTLANERIEILDIGTGSGNIPIAIARFAPNVSITSIDVSREALDVARQIIMLNESQNIQLVNASVFENFLPDQKFDVITANPPYIALNEFDHLQLEVQHFEPRIATTDESDGFTFLRRIVEVASERLRACGFLFVEIAYNQSEEAQRIAANVGLKNIEMFMDYAGHPRILSARK